jgi:hypothetical protein
MGLDEDGMPSRSGLHRHVQEIEYLSELVMTTRATSEALVRRLGEAPEGRQARLNIELMHGIVTKLIAASGAPNADGVKLDAKQVAFLAKAMNDLSKAQASDVATTLRLRKDLQAEMEAKLKEVEAEVADAETPLSPADMLARIRALYNGEG